MDTLVATSTAPPRDMVNAFGHSALKIVERVFLDTFSSYRTVLVGGRDEPLYQPARDPATTHTLYYREDYFASALHEAAHWCIAGAARRQQVDFGYWYEPDGRDAGSQRAFESVEVKPQAIEWFFAQACGYSFRVSVDNLDQGVHAESSNTDFARAVVAQAEQFRKSGLPRRAQQLFDALAIAFDTRVTREQCRFSLASLR